MPKKTYIYYVGNSLDVTRRGQHGDKNIISVLHASRVKLQIIIKTSWNRYEAPNVNKIAATGEKL